MNTDSKILASILKHMSDNESDPLSPLIDEYLIKRDIPEFRKKRLETYTVPIKPRVRPLGRLSPSSLLDCERRASWRFLGVSGRKRMNPDTELIFEDGVWRHHKWQAFFKDMELVLGNDRFRCLSIEENIRIPKLYIAGTLDVHISIFLDGVWVDYVLDIKGTNNYIFEDIYRKREPKDVHTFQILPYMRAKKVHRGMIFYDSKEKNKTHVCVVAHDKKKWAKVRLWSSRVIGQIEDQVVPKKHSECNPGNFMYSSCPFRNLCWGDKTSRQIQRKVYKDFPGVQELWKRGLELEQEV